MAHQFNQVRVMRPLLHNSWPGPVALPAPSNILAPTLMFLLAMLCLAFAATNVMAGPSLALIRKADVRSGTLLFPANEEGKFVQAPLVGTDIDVTVSGATARTRVTQHFYNPTEGWVEGVYVFPLPENSAVDSLKMVIGTRIIAGEIQEKQKAKEIYEEAKAEGKKAVLMEQERPNVFTNSVANIGPRETVVIQMEYQQTVPQANGQFSLRVPLVVAPRYNPAPVVQTVGLDSKGWAQTSDPVPDRARIEPPVLDPRVNPPTNPVILTVHLNAGFPLGEIKSHHHAVKMEGPDEARLIKIDGTVPADKDFELTWNPKTGNVPAAGLFHEKLGGSDYVLAFVTPPSLATAPKQRAREIIFVIDNSGSMGGLSMLQAKSSLLFGVDHLQPSDSFNIVRFDDTMETLFPAAVPASGENINRAKALVFGIDARGGTEMVPAMKAALADNSGRTDTLRQVVFLTDGAIGNETQLFDAIVAGRGRSRIFMVGIGSAPNSYLMSRAAELGRGGFMHIGSTMQVDERMRELFLKLERPAVTDISVAFSDGTADVTPKVMPDLYAGDTLQIGAKVTKMDGTIEIKGMIGEQPWIARIPLAQAAEGKGLSKAWARAKIDDAEVGVRLGQLTLDDADKRILQLAIEHGLLSRLTSLVAVDKTPSRPDNAKLARADVPLNLPAGWDFDKVFGGQPRVESPTTQPGSPEGTPELIDASYQQAVAVSHQPLSATTRAAQSQAGVHLPQTATNAPVYLMGGALLILLGLPVLLVLRRRETAGQE